MIEKEAGKLLPKGKGFKLQSNNSWRPRDLGGVWTTMDIDNNEDNWKEEYDKLIERALLILAEKIQVYKEMLEIQLYYEACLQGVKIMTLWMHRHSHAGSHINTNFVDPVRHWKEYITLYAYEVPEVYRHYYTAPDRGQVAMEENHDQYEYEGYNTVENPQIPSDMFRGNTIENERVLEGLKGYIGVMNSTFRTFENRYGT